MRIADYKIRKDTVSKWGQLNKNDINSAYISMNNLYAQPCANGSGLDISMYAQLFNSAGFGISRDGRSNGVNVEVQVMNVMGGITENIYIEGTPMKVKNLTLPPVQNETCQSFRVDIIQLFNKRGRRHAWCNGGGKPQNHMHKATVEGKCGYGTGREEEGIGI